MAVVAAATVESVTSPIPKIRHFNALATAVESITKPIKMSV